MLVHLAAWSGLRAAELASLQVGDVTLPGPSLNPNAPAKPGTARVERIAWAGATPMTVPPKTKGSRRTVPLTAATTAMLRDYLAAHERGDDPTAPPFPNVRLRPPRRTGVTLTERSPGIEPGSHEKANRQATTLADCRRQKQGSGWCSTGTRRYGTPPSTRPRSARPCCGRDGLPQLPHYRRG